jgi:hypothetical protein
MGLMNLQTMREFTGQLMGDTSGTLFTPEVLRDWINLAYESVYDLLAESAASWNMHVPTSAAIITTVAKTREYLLPSNVYNIRRILEVTRTDVSPPQRLAILDSSARDGGDGPGRRSWTNAECGAVYVYRRGNPPGFDSSPTAQVTDMAWVVGFSVQDPGVQTLRVDFMPQHAQLIADEQLPTDVPPELMDLIVYKAAIIGKISMNRDASGSERLYAEKLASSRRTITQMAGRGTRWL